MNEMQEMFKRGKELSNRGEYMDAAKEYSRVLELDPENEGAYIGRGLAWTKLGEWERAIGDYSQAILLSGGGGSVSYLGRGLANAQLGRWDRAISDISRAIEEDEGNAIAYVNRGNIYMKVKEYVRAIKDYSRAAILDFHYIHIFLLCNTFFLDFYKFLFCPPTPPPEIFPFFLF